MIKVYRQGGIFSFPRRSRKLAWYVEILCSKLLQQDKIGEESIEWFWDEIKKKQDELPFPWQRVNLEQEAKARLDDLLRGKADIQP
jgi:hypothetical protein